MIQTDRIATAEKRFEHPKSRVMKDGREILHGADWKRRKWELWERSGGQCEAISFWAGEEPIRCRWEADDPDHVVKRSKGRDDRLEALMALCRNHHQQKHPEFQPRWTKRQGEAAA
jgi:hypothetical protein